MEECQLFLFAGKKVNKQEIESQWWITLVHNKGGAKTVSGRDFEEVKVKAQRQCEAYKGTYILCTLPYNPIAVNSGLSHNSFCGSLPKKIKESWDEEIQKLYMDRE